MAVENKKKSELSATFVFHSKPSRALTVITWISAILVLLGEFFKVNHYPGASPMLILGSFCFLLFYLPLYSIESWRFKTSLLTKIALIIQVLILFLIGTAFLFKLMHWPGSGPLYILSNLILIVVILPFGLYHLVKAGRSSLISFHSVFLVIYFFLLYVGSLTGSGSGKISIDAVQMQGVNTEQALQAATSRNQQFYATLNSVSKNQNKVLFDKIIKLKIFTDSSIAYIHNLQSLLLSQADNIPIAVADTLSSIYIQSTNNMDIPTKILIGNEYDLNKGWYSAFKLKTVIHAYRDSLLNMVQTQNRTIIEEGFNLKTDNYTDAEGEPLKWEMANFYHKPFLYIFNTLTNIRYEIKNAEYQVLTDIVNSGNSELNSALFSQITDLNTKYDAFKKQQQITRLQSENDKSMELLNNKDSELSHSQQIIIYFLLSTLLFIVLLFFIIRSNYLRKQSNKKLKEQKQVIETQKTIVEEKQREILDSIEYALRIQTAILPPPRIVKQYLENSFILYLPKDIVAGDFYWMEQVPPSHPEGEMTIPGNTMHKEFASNISSPSGRSGGAILFAACDCTGHGVPGAMVSVVCHNALNRAVREFGLTKPSEILDKTDELVIENFSTSEELIKDGMDVSLCALNLETKELQWAGANNPLWIVRNTQQSNFELIETKADKQPIGMNEDSKPFTNHTLILTSGDTIYLFTDGFADQFGGDTGDKKLTRKRFKELLLSIQNYDMQQQGEELKKFLENYRRTVEQIDDILVIGVRV